MDIKIIKLTLGIDAWRSFQKIDPEDSERLGDHDDVDITQDSILLHNGAIWQQRYSCFQTMKQVAEEHVCQDIGAKLR